MIKIHCVTYEDSLRNAIWPEELCCKPEIGEWISSKDDRYLRKIVRIEHCWHNGNTTSRSTLSYPYLKIELERTRL